MITEYEIILRLSTAAALGLVVGFERERQNQPAGLRTQMIVVIGAALAMALSINLAIVFRPLVPNGDPARLAAQVISGIGFLGAGAILRYGTNIKGLTTAASLWTMAIVGLTVGAGFYLTAIAATALLMIILTILNWVEKRLISSFSLYHVIIDACDRPGLVEEIKNRLSTSKRNRSIRSVNTFGLEKDLGEGSLVVDVVLRMWKDETPEGLADELTAIEGVTRVKVSE